MPDVLLDTGPVISLADRTELRHADVRAYFRTSLLRLHLPSVVLGEMFTFLRSRKDYRTARRAVEGLTGSSVVTIHQLDAAFDRDIWAVTDEFAGVPLSYADASLVVLGRRLRIQAVFSFDDDLRQAGFDLVPDR